MVKSKRKKRTQQIVIPKGVIKADEIAVLQIPRRYQHLPVVIAKKEFKERPQMLVEEFFVDTQSNARHELFPDIMKQSNQPPPTQSRALSLQPSPNQGRAVSFVPGPSTQNGNSRHQYQAFPLYEPSTENENSIQQYQAFPLYEKPIASHQFDHTQTHSCLLNNQNSRLTTNLIAVQPIPKYQSCTLQPLVPCGGSFMSDNLIQREQMERNLIKRSLEEFQEARRRFIEKANILAGKLNDDDSSSSD